MPRTPKLPGDDEHAHAKMVAAWLDQRHYIYFHPANEGKRSYKVAAMLKAEGFKKGIPDYLIFGRFNGRVVDSIYDLTHKRDFPKHGIACELKSPRGTLRPEQEKWLADLADCGWYTFVAHGIDDFVAGMGKLGL